MKAPKFFYYNVKFFFGVASGRDGSLGADSEALVCKRVDLAPRRVRDQ